MNRCLSIQVPLVTTIVLGLILFVIGWSNHRQLTQLRNDHQDLVHQAESLGLNPDNPVALSKRTRSIDRDQDVDRIARDFIGIGIECKNCYNDHHFSQLDANSRARVIEQVDHVLSLNQNGLQRLIEIIIDQPELDQAVRRTLLNFALQRWAELNPAKALDFLAHSPKLAEQLGRGFRMLISQMVVSWAREAPDEVTPWLRKSHASLTKDIRGSVIYNLAQTIVIKRPFETFDLINEFSENPHSYFPVILQNNKLTVTERTEILVRVREMAKELENPNEKKKFLFNNLKGLVLGQKNHHGDFQTAIDTINANHLGIDELEFIWNPAITDLGYHIKQEQAGQWINWLRKSIPEAKSKQRVNQLLSDWKRRDPDGAADFLKTRNPNQ